VAFACKATHYSEKFDIGINEKGTKKGALCAFLLNYEAETLFQVFQKYNNKALREYFFRQSRA